MPNSLTNIISNSAQSLVSSNPQNPFEENFTSSNGSFSGAALSGVTSGAISAIPQAVKSNIQAISDFRFGTILQRQGILSGSAATLVNGAIDFIRNSSKTSSLNTKNLSAFQTFSLKFIPIILKSEFLLDNGNPLYIVFDSTPESISFTRNANWSPKDFLGRPDPVQTFSGSTAISFSLKGLFFSDSADQHATKLALSDKLFAFVTPSKKHFMPSPVYVRIGEWKTIRCITNNITVEYKGPWWVNQANPSQMANNAPQIEVAGYALGSHSPYMFEVTFNFTVTPLANKIKYAEDIISNSSGQSGFEPDITDQFSQEALLPLIEQNTTSVGQFANLTSQVSSARATQQTAELYAGIQDYDYIVTLPQSYLDALQKANQSINTEATRAAFTQVTSGLSGITQQGLSKIIGSSNLFTKIK